MFFTQPGLGLGERSARSDGPAPVFASLSSSFSFRDRAPHPGFASLSLAAVPGQAQSKGSAPPKASEPIKEAITGQEFSREFCTRGNRDCGVVTGLGVRAKSILGLKNINVYAVGLYVDPDAARSNLKSYRGQPADKLIADKSFMNDFMAADGIEKTIRIKINYGGISRGAFWDALKERLEPPMAAAGEAATVAAFGSQFDDVKFRKGLDIAFSCKGKSTTTWVDGKKVNTINSKSLNKALMGIYMGDSPVSEGAKANFKKGLAEILSRK